MDDEDYHQSGMWADENYTITLKDQALCRMQLLGNYAAESLEIGYCQTYDDGVLCWPKTAINTTLQAPCPDEIRGIAYETKYEVTRHCDMNGVWQKANYTGCLALTTDLEPEYSVIHLRIMYYVYWAGYTLSLVFLTLALAIFAHYRSLWCLRNIIHSNLILCFALHNLSWIIYSLVAHEIMTVYLGAETVAYSHISTTILKYFITAGFFWMFVEGLYLLISVMFSFHTRRIRFWMCALIGWIVPLILIIGAGIARAHEGNNVDDTWNDHYHLDYIFIGPVLCVLMINVIFLLIIMSVVVTKLQATVAAEATRYKKVIKALFILCPLLGINYLFVLAQPTNPIWLKLIFSYAVTVMTSLQGFLVAVFFCFRNNEVRLTIRKSIRRWRRAMKRATTRDSMRSETPSFLDLETSSPGRSARHSIQVSANGPNASRHGRHRPFESTSQHVQPRFRNVVLISENGQFRVFLPQSYVKKNVGNTSRDQQNQRNSGNLETTVELSNTSNVRKISSTVGKNLLVP